MSQLLAQAQQMQQQLMAAQQEMAEAEVTGQAGGGLVTATVKGTGEVVGLKIDPKVVDPDDVETLQDLVIGAINNRRLRVWLEQEQIWHVMALASHHAANEKPEMKADE